MKRLLLKFLFVTLAITITISLQAKTIYLSTSGQNSNDGLSSSKPVASFSVAYNKASNGDQIIVNGFIDISTDPANAETPKTGCSLSKSLTISGASNATDGFDAKKMSRIFIIIGAKTQLTLKNLAFKNGYYESSEKIFGGAFFVQSGAVINGENLIFDGNGTKDTNEKFGDLGGAIYIASTKGLTFRNCIFKNNYSGLGGAINIQDGKDAVSRFENCAFVDNASFHNQGASAVRVRAGETVKGSGVSNCKVLFINSTFKGNKINGNGGGAINLYSCKNETEVSLVNCTVTENTTNAKKINVNSAAGIYVSDIFTDGGGKLSIYNSIIEGNKVIGSSLTPLNDIGFKSAPSTDGQLIISNSFIGRCVNYDETALPNVCYPQEDNRQNYFNYNMTSDKLKAGLSSFNSTNFYFPLLKTSPAVNFGSAKYLQNYNLSTDQLGNKGPFTKGACAAGTVEKTE